MHVPLSGCISKVLIRRGREQRTAAFHIKFLESDHGIQIPYNHLSTYDNHPRVSGSAFLDRSLCNYSPTKPFIGLTMTGEYPNDGKIAEPKAVGSDGQSVILGELHGMDDDAILRAQGHAPALKRTFNTLGTLGLGFR